jgi:hypothetical protein
MDAGETPVTASLCVERCGELEIEGSLVSGRNDWARLLESDWERTCLL